MASSNRKYGRNSRAPSNSAQPSRTSANKSRRIAREARRQSKAAEREFSRNRAPVTPTHVTPQFLARQQDHQARQAEITRLARIKYVKGMAAEMFSLGLRARVANV